ncbi:transcription factor LUX-like [Gossypium australe]|uniref:Transcription factor LUX-like n=2 Tax=Gossypium TaxID=3633 RepID=A0A5B6X285_9ROSI|nr:transcription factor LUX-like [Gossypium australe]
MEEGEGNGRERGEEEDMDYAQKMRKCHEYVEGLEEERRKIQVFQRELPLCFELVTQAIESCKKEMYMQGQSECSEQTSSDSPVLEEFIPIKRSCNCSEEDDDDDDENVAAADKKKSDWLRSVQLWNPPSKEDVGKTGSGVQMKGNGGAFQPFHKEKGNVEKKSVEAVGKGNASATATTTTTSASTTESGSRGIAADDGNTNKKVEKGQQQQQPPQRKQRRCWSSELHKRFLHALQQLGGSHVATPKQIRELMKVDGLTNDEVKSHLQKYRLHTRRPSPSINSNGNNPQTPQFVVVGGIWVPPQEYASVATTAAVSGETSVTPSPNSGVYAPVAVPLPTLAKPSVQRPQRSQSEDRGSHSEGRVHSNSPSTSSSTHTTTDRFPAF